METENMDVLQQRANEVAGREVDVEKVADGKFIVMWMRFESSPPPTGATEAEALEEFIQYRLSQKKTEVKLPMDDTKTEDSNESGDRSSTKSNKDDSSP